MNNVMAHCLLLYDTLLFDSIGIPLIFLITEAEGHTLHAVFGAPNGHFHNRHSLYYPTNDVIHPDRNCLPVCKMKSMQKQSREPVEVLH